MRFMIIGRATKETEAGVLPPPEAVEWVKRAPNAFSPNGEAEVEIRKVMDLEDSVPHSRRTPKSRR
jgi:hypothetical protein